MSPPWKNSQGETIDPAFEAAYTNNLTHIMALHTEGEIVKSYNFPTENLQGGVDEIMSHIENIYDDQSKSFKLNINLGFILRNRKDGTYRYYIPYQNSYLFQTPFTITRHGSLRSLRNKVKRLNPTADVENQRPNSAWELAYITNIHFDISLLDYVFGHTTALPQHVKDSRSIVTFTEQADNLCFFRCMAWHQCQNVKDIDNYAKRYQCLRCFKRYFNLKRHYSVCSKVTKFKFPGGFHKTSQTVFEELEKYGIEVAQKDRVFPYFITYDFEAVLQKLNRDTTKKLIWEEKHIPISVGVVSNVEEFKNGVCYVNYDLDELLSQMIERMHTIANAVKTEQVQKFAWVFEQLKTLQNSFQSTIEIPVSTNNTTFSTAVVAV